MQLSATSFANYRNALGINDMMRGGLGAQNAAPEATAPVVQEKNIVKKEINALPAAKALTLASLRPVRDGIAITPAEPVPIGEPVSDKMLGMLKRIHHALNANLRNLNEHPLLTEKAAQLLKRIAAALEQSSDPHAGDLKSLSQDIAEILGKGKFEKRDLVQLHGLLGKLGGVLDEIAPANGNPFEGFELTGVYGNGRLKAENGWPGFYSQLPSGQYAFTIGLFKGVTYGDHQAVAFDPNGKAAYTFEWQAEGGVFQLFNVKQVDVEEARKLAQRE